MTDVEGTVVDTDVFSLLFVRSSSADSRAVAWRDVLGIDAS
jgi:hypothetical protein